MAKKYIGIVFTVLLTLIPIGLWIPSIAQGAFTLRNISQALALSGAVLLAINFILAGRFKFMESYFGGLSRLYVVHHFIGQVSLIILLFHPIFLGIYYLRLSLTGAFDVLFPPLSDIATWFGTAAIVVLVSLLIITLYVKLPYNIWKLTHKFLGISLLLATVHIFLINSTVSYNKPLRYYMLSICFIGIAVYFYKLFAKYLAPKHYYKVVEITPKNEITEIKLKPVGSLIKNYLPGQFIFVSFNSPGVSKEFHPFSLTSIPEEGYLSISAKSLGDYTQTLKNLKPDSPSHIEGPFGEFSYLNSPRKKQIWVAGGIGITPFISMAKSLKDKTDYDIILYYVTSSPSEAIYSQLLTDISQKNAKFKLVLYPSNEKGHITAQNLVDDSNDISNREIYICGPVPMMRSLRDGLNQQGIRNAHIITEEFSLD